jgi:phosphoribosyl-AMP cyclohydrolase
MDRKKCFLKLLPFSDIYNNLLWVLGNKNHKEEINKKRVKMVSLDFKKTGGLIPAIAQDAETGEVLMLAYMNQAAWESTLVTGKATYFSRSRNELWVKGSTSGNVQIVKEIRIDCDNDTVLLLVDQIGGAACHTGYRTCFHQKIEGDGNTITLIGEPVFDPNEVYKNEQ